MSDFRVESSASAEPLQREYVLAWAYDAATGLPRHIMELTPAERGWRANCICPGCQQPLGAVKPGQLPKNRNERQPHFRHKAGTHKDSCAVLVARMAALEALIGGDRILLPGRRRSSEVQGLSGTYHEAVVSREAESVSIVAVQRAGFTEAQLTLDDGRVLNVRIAAHAGDDTDSGAEAALVVYCDDPGVAALPLDDIRRRLVLGPDCWRRHWNDDELARQANAMALVTAQGYLDWPHPAGDFEDFPGEELTHQQQRESLLHRVVKEILQEARFIGLPELVVEAKGTLRNRTPISHRRVMPAERAQLSLVCLERRLGDIIPDVIAVRNHPQHPQLIVEVTVTNRIGDERRARIAAHGIPAVEIDLNCHGGLVTREELRVLILEDHAGKRWLYHPDAASMREAAQALVDADLLQDRSARPAPIRPAFATMPPPVLAPGRLRDAAIATAASALLDAVRRDGRLRDFAEDTRQVARQDIEAAISDLVRLGFPEARNTALLRADGISYPLLRLVCLRDNRDHRLQSTVDEMVREICAMPVQNGCWHALYLMAVKCYAPTLSDDVRDQFGELRSTVLESLCRGESAFERERDWDRLLGICFPELAESLKWRSKADPVQTSRSEQKVDPFAPPPLEPKARDALAKAAGKASSRGATPIGFAQIYAPTIGRPESEVMQNLFAMGIAKNRSSWS